MTLAWLSTLAARIRAQLSDRGAEQEIDAELHDHFERLVEQHRRDGLPPDEARRRAHVRLGGVAQLKEDQRERRRLPLVDTIGRDLRYAVRVLRRSPAFTLAAVLTLAVGIGATTAIFGLVDAVLLRPMPYAAPGRLVRIFETNPLKQWTRNVAAPANYADWRAQNTVFTDVAAYEVFDETKGSADVFLSGIGDPQRLSAMPVSGTLLRLLGTPPLLGRTFTDEETYKGQAREVVLSYPLWQTLYQGRPDAIGRTITLSGRAYDIVGVMPRGFFFPRRDVQLWYPLGYEPSVFVKARRPHWLSVLARLKPGVSIEQARADLASIAKHLEQQYPDTNTEMGVRLEPFHDSLVSEARTPLLLLLGAVGLLFLIVCVNLASLQVGRVAERSREMAIRQALGAGRRRLMVQLLTEGLVLSVAGGLVGLVVAAGARAAIIRYGPATLGLYADPAFGRGVLLFAVGLTLLAPVLFGLTPALTAVRGDLLNDRSGASRSSRRSARDLLVAGEMALSIVLVVGAGLMLRSLDRLQHVSPGFSPDHVLTFGLDLPDVRYPDNAARARGIERIEDALSAHGSIAAVGTTTTLALGGFSWSSDSTVEGRSHGNDYPRELWHDSVTPGYFEAMGIPLVNGREFDAHDTGDGPPVAIVNRALARQYFGGEDPVGRRITYGRPQDKAPWVTIVGVVADAKQDGMDAPVRPAAYDPFPVRPRSTVTVAVRTGGRPAAVVAEARAAVRSVDSQLVMTDVRTMEDVVRASTADERFRASLVSGFAVVALLLAALGIYGVLAYFVTQRTREIGVRLALGARPASVFWMVVRQALRPVVPAALAGLAVAYAATGLLQSLLFGVERLDRPTYLATTAIIVATAIVAAALPAVRAVRVDPMTALRED